MTGLCACPLLAESLTTRPVSPLEPLVQGQRNTSAQVENASLLMNNNDIRKKIRQQRNSLTSEQRLQASISISENIVSSPLFMRAKHIAVYLSHDGEIDISSIFQTAWQRGKHCYLPVLRPHGKKLSFAPYTPESIMRNNRYGIAEPVVSKRALLTPQQLNLVLAPLVAFDKNGNRIGMGGGYYDRSFAFLRRQQHYKQVKLCGTGFSFQQIEDIEKQDWDVPLCGAFTDEGFMKLGE